MVLSAWLAAAVPAAALEQECPTFFPDLRIAITDRLALIATKDGFAVNRPDNDLLREDEGFFDISGGPKYALIDRPEDDFILTPSVRFDFPVGSGDLFSGNGEVQFVPALSAAWGLGDFHVIASMGGRIPFDRDDESTSFFYAAHFDYRLLDWLTPFVELVGHHRTDGGDGELSIKLSDGTKITLNDAQAALGTGRFEGADVVNLGSRGVGGNDLATFTAGARFRITEHLDVGAAYEVPITDRKDVFNQRVTPNVLLEY